MKRICVAWVALAVVVTLGIGQEIPKGIRYVRAKEADNKKVEALLRKVFSQKPETADFSGLSSEVVVCGPTLLGSARKALDKFKEGTKEMQFVFNDATGTKKLAGRVFRTAESQDLLWTLLLAMAKAPTKPIIRKAKPDELSYYWAIIPYDIEEPLFVVELGKGKPSLLFNFEIEGGKPKLFFVDVANVMTKRK